MSLVMRLLFGLKSKELTCGTAWGGVSPCSSVCPLWTPDGWTDDVSSLSVFPSQTLREHETDRQTSVRVVYESTETSHLTNLKSGVNPSSFRCVHNTGVTHFGWHIGTWFCLKELLLENKRNKLSGAEFPIDIILSLFWVFFLCIEGIKSG